PVGARPPRDEAVGVVDVAEDDRLGGAGLLGGGGGLPVAGGAGVALRSGLRRLGGRRAAGGLLPDAPGTAGAGRGLLHLERLGETRGLLPHRVVVPVEVVEVANLVGAVVRAVARADAAVVRHLVQALGPVRRGVDRADVLAGRLFAVDAGERLVDGQR